MTDLEVLSWISRLTSPLPVTVNKYPNTKSSKEATCANIVIYTCTETDNDT